MISSPFSEEKIVQVLIIILYCCIGVKAAVPFLKNEIKKVPSELSETALS